MRIFKEKLNTRPKKWLASLLAVVMLVAMTVTGIPPMTPLTARADTITQLKTQIEAFDHGGYGTLSVDGSGGTVTVTGTVINVKNPLHLNLENGTSGTPVRWKAEYSGSIDGNALIELSGANGLFYIPEEGGSVINNSTYTSAPGSGISTAAGSKVGISIYGGTVKGIVGINTNGANTVKVMGGAVNGTTAIYTNGANAATVEVSGGVVTGGSYAILIQSNNSKVNISGGVVNNPGGTVISDYGGSVTGMTVTVSGGLVFGKGTSLFGNVAAAGSVIKMPGSLSPKINGSTGDNGVVCAWNRPTKTPTYYVDTNNDLLVNSDAYAVWKINGSQNGIKYGNGTNEGFFPIANQLVTLKEMTAPTNLTAVAGTGGITLNWKDTNSANSFIIERKEGSGYWSFLPLSCTTTTYTDTTAQAGKTYTYRVMARVDLDAISFLVSPYSNEATATMPVTYTVRTSTLTPFGSLATPYTQPAAQTVTITNTGTGTVTLTQPTSTKYDIGALSTTTLAAGGTATFTVCPKAGLAVGNHNETITINGTGGASAMVSASFVVTAAPTYTISASALTPFGSLSTPYTQPAAQTVTITNTGSGTVTLTQPTSTKYDIGTLSTTTLAAGGTATFTVRPKAGLAVGNHSETITINGTSGASATISASFTVTAATIAPTITTPNNTTVATGKGGVFQVAATGTTPITYSLSGQPAGVTINSGTGLITIAGTVAVGSYPFTITASNGTTPNATQSFTLTVTAATVAPTITGPTTMTLTAGYSATSTGVYTVTGNPAPTVTKTSGDAKITWNNAARKLDIAAGLAAGTYTVVLTARNGTLPDAPLTFTLTVTASNTAPTITGSVAMTLITGYGSTSTGAYTITGTPAPTVTKTSGDAKITWNNTTKKLEIAAGLAVGTYTVVLKATNGVSPDATLTFTLTVTPTPAFYQAFIDDDGELRIWADAGIVPVGAVFEVERFMPPPKSAEDKVNDQLGGGTIIDYWEIRLKLSGEYITELDGYLTIATKLPEGYESGAGVTVYMENSKGELIKMDTWVDGGFIFLRTNWLETYA